MNRFIIVLVFSVLLVNLIQAQDSLYIYKSGIKVSAIASSDIDSVSFISRSANSQNRQRDTLFLYKSGVVVKSRPIAQIDSVGFEYRPVSIIQNNDTLTQVLNAPFGRMCNFRIYADSEVEPVRQLPSEDNYLALCYPDSFGVTKASGLLGEEYLIHRITGDAFVANSDIAIFRKRHVYTKSTVAFWINHDDLNGNDLKMGIYGFLTVPNNQLKLSGSSYLIAGVSVVVDTVVAGYSHLTVRYPDNLCTHNFTLAVSNQAGKPVLQLRVVNPAIFDGNVAVDPFCRYRTQAEKLHSKYIGQSVVFFGDSQLSFKHVAQVAERLGVSTQMYQEGGRAIKYRKEQSAFDYNWLYHWSRLRHLKKLKGDVFVFHCSTNDNEGGGILSDESVNRVLDSYPNINDTDTAVIRGKLVAFGSMTEASKMEVFNFKSVMGAMITQIKRYNPAAKIYLCTIPLSRGTYSAPADIRALRVPVYLSIRKDIYEIGDFYGCKVIDAYSLVELTPENALEYEPDGTHWSVEIQNNLGKLVATELLKD